MSLDKFFGEPQKPDAATRSQSIEEKITQMEMELTQVEKKNPGVPAHLLAGMKANIQKMIDSLKQDQ